MTSLSDRLEDLFDDAKDALIGNQRQLDLEQWSEKHRYHYIKRVPISSMDLAVRSLRLFRNKKRTRIYHHMSGPDPDTESTVEIMDLGLRGGNKKVTTCVIFDSNLLNLPRFIIRPKKALEKVTSVFSTQDDPLAPFPELQKHFTLQTKHPQYMERYITEQFSLRILTHPELTLEGLDNFLLGYREGARTEVQDLKSQVNWVRDITETILFDHSNELL